jgi:hypothetical protein
MEEQLTLFVDTAQPAPAHLDPAARFIHSQVVELVKLCLEKSHSNQLTCAYFDEVTSSLERLLGDAYDKFAQVDYLSRLIKRFLLIIARVARLLECIEFDPLEFSQLLAAAEQQARQEAIAADIPKYIIGKLGIAERDPFDQLCGGGANGASSSNDGFNLNLNSCGTDDFMSMMTSGCNSGSGAGLLAIDSPSSSLVTQSSSLTSMATTPGSSMPHQQPQLNIVSPTEDDFEEVKLISNGAYG